jgi:hypothetical protein
VRNPPLIGLFLVVGVRVIWTGSSLRLTNSFMHALCRPLLLVAFFACATSLRSAETVWFGGTQRALPISLVSPKEDGIRSLWAWTDDHASVWDLNLGTDISVWQRASERCYQSAGPRFGVNTRFQFNSGSFDLWAVDVRGGGVYGIAFGETALEAFFYHESSHLGDEILASGQRQRIDSSVNGLRLTASHQWKKWLRTYGGASIQPWAEPAELESFGFHLGAEVTRLPPFERGYLAAEAETWEWRSWDPDAAFQAGLFIGPKDKGKALEQARLFVEARFGRVMLGQYYNETESYFGVGIATSW